MTGYVQAAVFLLLLCRMAAPAVSGRVFKADGSPAPHAYVTLAGDDGNIYAILYGLIAETDGDGRYRMTGLPAGLHSLEASNTSLGTGEREIDLHLGENQLDITLSEELVARGHVVDPDGRPVADAVVEKMRRSVHTDAQGAFAILVDEDGYELIATKAGYSPAYLTQWAARGSRVGLELRLGYEASVSGRLPGLDPGKTGEVNILAISLPHSEIQIPGEVKPDGTYRISGLGAGEWFLSAELDKRSVTATVTIAPGETEVIQDLSFSQTEVRGRVVDAEGQPAAEIAVGLMGPAEKFWAKTGPDGTFSAEVPDATYEILAFKDDLAATQGGVVTVAGEPVESLEIRLQRTAALAVRLLGISDKDLDDFQVQIQIEAGAFRAYARRQETAGQPGAPPVYLFEDFELGPGTWTLRAEVNAETVVRQVAIRPGERHVQVDLPFSFGNLSLSGRITGYRIPKGGTALLRKMDDDNYWREEIQEDGTFVYPRLRPGRYLLVVWDERKSVKISREIDLSSNEELEIDLGAP